MIHLSHEFENNSSPEKKIFNVWDFSGESWMSFFYFVMMVFIHIFPIEYCSFSIVQRYGYGGLVKC